MAGAERHFGVLAEVVHGVLVVPLQHFLRGRELSLRAEHAAELGDELGAHGRIHLSVAARFHDRLFHDVGDARRPAARRARFGLGKCRDHETAHRIRAMRGVARDAALPQREAERGEDGEREHRRSRDAAAMARDEFARAIPASKADARRPAGRRAGARRRRRARRPTHSGVRGSAAIAFSTTLSRSPRNWRRVTAGGAGSTPGAVSSVTWLDGVRPEPSLRRWPVTSSPSSTPSAYTSVAVVIRRAAALLGRGVGRRERRQVRLRLVVRVEQLGDAEVEQLDLAVGGDEHVRRLQIAMHDQRAMRGFDRAAHLQEQLQARAQIEPIVARIVGDRHAVDEIERDVRAGRFR